VPEKPDQTLRLSGGWVPDRARRIPDICVRPYPGRGESPAAIQPFRRPRMFLAGTQPLPSHSGGGLPRHVVSRGRVPGLLIGIAYGDAEPLWCGSRTAGAVLFSCAAKRKVPKREGRPEPPKTPALLAEAGARPTAHPCAAVGFALPARTALARGLIRLRLRCSAAATGPDVKTETQHRQGNKSVPISLSRFLAPARLNHTIGNAALTALGLASEPKLIAHQFGGTHK
jgi:hypothetical protein